MYPDLQPAHPPVAKSPRPVTRSPDQAFGASPLRFLHAKHPRTDLRRRYVLHLEWGFVLTMTLLLALLRAPITASDDGLAITPGAQEVVQIEEIRPTTQPEMPPPPPRPPVPVEVPDDMILEEDFEMDATLDLDAPLAELPPPPPLPQPEQAEEVPEPEIFVIVEEMPTLIGGLAGLQQKIHYPEMARRAGVEGRVILQFVVDEEGRVTDAVVLRGIGGGADEEALRVLRQARFTPGRQRGVPVRVRMTLPVVFKIR